MKSLEKRKKIFDLPQQKKYLVIFLKIKTWGAQGKMTQISLIVNSMPRDLTEFAFFLAVGFTAGSMGLIWFSKKFYLIVNKFLNIILSYVYNLTSIKKIFYKGYVDIFESTTDKFPQL